MEQDQPLTVRIFKGSSTILIFTFLTSPFGYLLRILFSRTLTINDYGLFYSVLALFGILATYNDLGFGYSVSYFVPKLVKQGDTRTAWKIYLYDLILEITTSVVLSIILIKLSGWLSINYFKVGQSQPLIVIFCVYFVSSSIFNALNRMFNGLQKEKYYSSMPFARSLFTLVFSAFFWLFDIPNISYFAICWGLGYIISDLIYNYFLYREFEIPKKVARWDNKIFKLMLGYALPTLATTSIGSLILYTDTFFLTLFRGVKEVGVYNVILPIVSITSIFLSPVNSFILPLISHLMEGEKEKLELLVKMILKIIPFTGLYFCLFILAFPSSTTSVLFGQKWVGLVEIPLSVLAMGYIIAPLASYMTTIISGMGKVKERLRATIVLAVFSILLNLIFVYKLGVLGAAIANSLVYLLSVVLLGRIAKTVVNFKYPVRYYAKLILFSAAIYLFIHITKIYPTNLISFLIAGLIYTGVMALYALSSNLIDKQTFSLIKSSFGR